jgi:hypothetical protein
LRRDSPQASRSRHGRAGRPILIPLIPGCSVAGDQVLPGPRYGGPMPRRCPECKLAAPSGRRILAADGCASTSSGPAYCFCAVWGPGGPRGVAVVLFGHTGLGMLTCRIAGVACAPTYAQLCITFHDSACALTARRQLLRKVLIWPYRARSPDICVFLGVTTIGPYVRRSYCYAPYLVSVPLCRQLSDPLKF